MDQIWKTVFIVLSCYILGAIPSSYIMGMLVRNIDLRRHGSGNLGAANTFRVLGVKAAVPVLLFDVGKGFLAVKIVSIMGLEHFIYVLLAAFVVIVGHNYSIFVNFSGGKGVGTTTGAFIAMSPLAVGICFIIWLILLLVFRIVSVASILAATLLPITILVSNNFWGRHTHKSILYLSIFVALMVICKHRPNIRRLIKGTEERIF